MNKGIEEGWNETAHQFHLLSD